MADAGRAITSRSEPTVTFYPTTFRDEACHEGLARWLHLIYGCASSQQSSVVRVATSNSHRRLIASRDLMTLSYMHQAAVCCGTQMLTR